MGDLERMLGSFEEYRKWQQKEQEEIKEALLSLNEKVENLRIWRASIIGAAGILGAVSGFFASLISIFLVQS